MHATVLSRDVLNKILCVVLDAKRCTCCSSTRQIDRWVRVGALQTGLVEVQSVLHPEHALRTRVEPAREVYDQLRVHDASVVLVALGCLAGETIAGGFC